MDGQGAGHAGDGAFRTVDVDALAAEKGAVDAADALHEDKSVFIDVRHHEAEFVDVSGQHDVRAFAGRTEAGEGVAVGVGREFVAVRCDVISPDALGAGLEPGGRRRDDQVLEECERGLFHAITMQTRDGGGKTSTAEIPWGTIAFPA